MLFCLLIFGGSDEANILSNVNFYGNHQHPFSTKNNFAIIHTGVSKQKIEKIPKKKSKKKSSKT